MVGNLAQKNSWSLEKAFHVLYGAEEIKEKGKKKEVETALKNQEGNTQETPGGEQPKPKEEWEEALDDIGGHSSLVDAEFEKYGQ